MYSPRDNDHVQSAVAPSADLCELSLGALGDPLSSTGHVLRYRYEKVGANRIDLTVKLVQGTTVIATATHADIADTYVVGALTLSGAEADAITDYADLRVRLEATQV